MKRAGTKKTVPAQQKLIMRTPADFPIKLHRALF